MYTRHLVFIALAMSFVGAQELKDFRGEWHSVSSSFCSEIKAKGARISWRPFIIYAAPDKDTRCCEGLTVRGRGETADFGHFRVFDLDRGLYFLSFDLKTKKVNVPVLVDRIIEKRDLLKGCETMSKITVDKNTNELKWDEWVVLDEPLSDPDLAQFH
jgi:hypothetical protein